MELRRLVMVLGIMVVIWPVFYGEAKTVDELRVELDEKRKQLKKAQDTITEFQSNVREKQREARTLKDQIEIIEDSVKEISLTIDQTLKEIEETDAEIVAIEADIEIKEQEIMHQKDLLAEHMRAIYQLDQQSNIAVFLKYESFSEALQESATLAELQERGQKTLDSIQKLHQDLMTKRRELEDFKLALKTLHERQEQQQTRLQEQRASKERILKLTNAQETQFQQLLASAQQAHRTAEEAIKELDANIREELRRQGFGNLPSVGTLDWPIEQPFGISCGFHCPGYPYEYLIGKHSGIDIPTYVGTPIRAPADGYVARTHDAGGPGYNYILLLHGDNISTVYGHVSGFSTQEGKLITRGTVMGYTGGAPGTRGAGLSSGPHLHFEVRQQNVPIDPLRFLP